VTGRGSVSRLFIHFGMLCAAFAFASWWASHTILDTTRTRSITEAVLESADLRHFVAGHIASVTAPAVGVSAGSATTNSTYTNQLDAVLARPDIQLKLEQFVVDAHERLIGERTAPAVLDQATVRTLVAAAFPSVRVADLAKVHAVTFDVPQSQALFKGREALAHRFWLYFLGAVVLLALGLVTTDDRHAAVRLIGKWLIAITVAHLIVLWIVPVVILPAVTTNPWAHLVAAVARALDAGILTSLVVLAVVGVACLFVGHFIPERKTPAGRFSG
jgi:branched-subunit amino acid transport protein AzlD